MPVLRYKDCLFFLEWSYHPTHSQPEDNHGEYHPAHSQPEGDHGPFQPIVPQSEHNPLDDVAPQEQRVRFARLKNGR